jgi:hypothetical protein
MVSGDMAVTILNTLFLTGINPRIASLALHISHRISENDGGAISFLILSFELFTDVFPSVTTSWTRFFFGVPSRGRPQIFFTRNPQPGDSLHTHHNIT